MTDGGWPVTITRDPTHEKVGTALNISGDLVLATTGGYIGDAPPYQGHVVSIDRASGEIVHVWNSLCSDRHEIIDPSTCPDSDSAIWARAGAVVEPGTGRILVATGNAPYDRGCPPLIRAPDRRSDCFGRAALPVLRSALYPVTGESGARRGKPFRHTDVGREGIKERRFTNRRFVLAGGL